MPDFSVIILKLSKKLPFITSIEMSVSTDEWCMMLMYDVWHLFMIKKNSELNETIQLIITDGMNASRLIHLKY